jgi:hypothetical protein
LRSDSGHLVSQQKDGRETKGDAVRGTSAEHIRGEKSKMEVSIFLLAAGGALAAGKPAYLEKVKELVSDPQGAACAELDLFAAGDAVHGVFDWSWPSPGHQNPSKLFGVGEADKPLAFRSSPLGAIAGWSPPVLLFSGDRDMKSMCWRRSISTRSCATRGWTSAPSSCRRGPRHDPPFQLADALVGDPPFFDEKLAK